MTSSPYKKRKIVVPGRESDEESLLIHIADKNETVRVDCSSSSSRRRKGRPNRSSSSSGRSNNQDDRLRVLLEAANQVTDDEEEEYDYGHDHKNAKKKKEQEVVGTKRHSVGGVSSSVRKDEPTTMKLQQQPVVPSKIPGHYIGRPLPPPPRLPNVPFGYKITSVVIGQL